MATPAPSRRVTKKVRPPPRHAITDDFLEETFKKLSHAIVQIQQRNVSSLSFETHYRNAYNLCLHRKHKKLYDGIADLVVAHLERQAKERIEPAFPTSSVLTAAATASTAGVSSGSSSSARNRTTSLHEVPAVASSSSGTASYGQGRMAQAMEGETFLNAIKTTWQDHKISMGKIRDVNKYLDKTYTEPEGKASVYTLGLHLFLTHLIRHPKIPIQENLLNVSLAMIRIERDGEQFSQDLLRAVTDMMCELREVSNDDRKGEGEPIYKSWWQEKFLESTREYYTLEAETNVERLSAPEYLERVDRRLKEEKDRIQQYLHPTTEPLLFSLLDHVLISQNLQAVVDHPNAGLATLLAENRYTDLARMYRIFGRVGEGRSVMARAMRVWIVEQGQKIVDTLGTAQASTKPAAGASGENMDEDAPADTKGKGKEQATSAAAPVAGTAAHALGLALEWVNTVLELKDKMDKILVESFEKDRIFQNAINDAFLTFVNQVKKAPEYISIYLDDNLKKGLKGKNEAEVDAVLDKTVTLFRYLNDKDVFEDYYKRHLAKRLLSDRSVSDDAERGMLQKLKLECGASFVAKLEGMLKDVTASEDLNKGYRTYLQGLGGERRTITDLSVKVCTASFWPSNPDVPCNLPPEFIKIAKSFERYFETKHTGRKLAWHAEHGSVDVRIRFDKGVKDVNVATHGFVVLNCFADLEKGQSLTYEHLAAATGLSEANLKRTLQSLACAKYKILKKEPAVRTVSPTDTFTFNHAFTAPVVRLKIATIASRVENVEETKETDTRLEAERSQVIEAAIVRTMKSRKQLSTPELTNEVISQLSRRFSPKALAIKMSIEKLIEKEYLERDAKDRKLLRYLA